MTVSGKPRLWTALGVAVLLALGGWWWRSSHTAALPEKQKAAETNPNFPINDELELPCIGKVRCHSRQEEISFEAKGRTLKWPFKMYYLPSGMFVRAEFFKPGAKNYEFEAKELEEIYRSGGQILAGFPEKAAPASLVKVMESLYTNEAFDRATKINIIYVLLDESELGGKIQPCFIANIWGVSAGFMSDRVSEDDEEFLKYRVILDQNGVATFSDNGL